MHKTAKQLICQFYTLISYLYLTITVLLTKTVCSSLNACEEEIEYAQRRQIIIQIDTYKIESLVHGNEYRYTIIYVHTYIVSDTNPI